MRYALFSDVHANAEAFDAVLADAARRRPDAYVCLGDVVGYGPDPNGCAERVRALGAFVIAGNHDRAAAGRAGLSAFSAPARAAIEWTREILSEDHRAWLAALPLRLETPEFLAVHGSPRDPIAEYLLDLPAALANFAAGAFSRCFVGHTHVPGAFVLEADGRVAAAALPEDGSLSLSGAARYIVNAGSVGQPRDGDPRAAYLLFDAEARTVRLERVRYAVSETQAKMAARGLPEVLARRLDFGY